MVYKLGFPSIDFHWLIWIEEIADVMKNKNYHRESLMLFFIVFRD